MKDNVYYMEDYRQKQEDEEDCELVYVPLSWDQIYEMTDDELEELIEFLHEHKLEYENDDGDNGSET